MTRPSEGLSSERSERDVASGPPVAPPATTFWVAVAAALVEQLETEPTQPVTLRVTRHPTQPWRLELTATRHDCGDFDALDGGGA
jgi:hypothetical protein